MTLVSRRFAPSLFAALLLGPALAEARPCEDPEEEMFEISPDGFARWCEGPEGPTTEKEPFDRAGRPYPPPPLERSSVVSEIEAHPEVFSGPRARPFAFSNWGPGRGQVVAAFGMRFFPTITEAPIPAADLGVAIGISEDTKFDARATIGGLVNTADLVFTPGAVGVPEFSLAARVGASLTSRIVSDWNIGFGPRFGLAISFGSHEAQFTVAGDAVAYVAGEGEASAESSRVLSAWRGQIVGEFDLSPTQRANTYPDTVTRSASDRASLFVELGVEVPLAVAAGVSESVHLSVSMGVVF
jgi:hypothetical protein